MPFSFDAHNLARAGAAVIIGLSALALTPAARVVAATVTVPCTGNSAADSAALVAAITAHANNDVIVLTAGCTYTLTAPATGSDGFPPVTDTLTVKGNGDTITRSGATRFRFFDVTGTLSVSGIVFTNGDANGGYGGALLNQGAGTVTVTSSSFSGNAGYGGALGNTSTGTLNVVTSTFSGNGSGVDGGAIFGNVGTINVSSSTFVNNTSDFGGAIAYENSTTGMVVGSTFSGNTSSNVAGAITADSNVAIINDTLTGNTAASGGALYDNGSGTLTLINDTIDGNTSTGKGQGGGVDAHSGTVTVTNTIVSNNSAPNCSGTVTDGGHNLENGLTCAFAANAVNADPGLAGLASDGGPTQTQAITSSSPAADKGGAAVCAAALPAGAGGVDQRGNPRSEVSGDATCDIGAFEIQPVVVPVTPASGAGVSEVSLIAVGGGALLLLTGLGAGRRRGRSAG